MTIQPSEPAPANALPSGDELLLAFRFLTNELSESERLVFEARLSEDQEAREALAHVVQLSTALRTTQPLSSRHTVRSSLTDSASKIATVRGRTVTNSWQRAFSLLASLTALVLFALILRWNGTTPHNGTTQEDLVLLYSDLKESEGFALSEHEEAELSRRADDVPDWLLAAVGAETEAEAVPHHDLNADGVEKL